MDDRASNLPAWLRRGIERTERERKAAIIYYWRAFNA